MRGLLDDAYELAEKLKDALADAEGIAGEQYSPRLVTRVGDLAAQADDLASRIDNLRSALRGS
jgi:hypothetical protein